MPIELSTEQGKALDAESESPPRVVDPRTNRIYVLVEAEQYDRMKALLQEESDIRAPYPLMDAVAAKEGWDDRSLDIYNDLVPREKRGASSAVLSWLWIGRLPVARAGRLAQR